MFGAEVRADVPRTSWCGGVAERVSVLNPVALGVPGTQPCTVGVRCVIMAVQEFQIGAKS